MAAPSPEDGVAQVKLRPGPMASSGTEVRWAEPCLGKGPRRRRWAWAEEEKDAVGSVPHSWEEEGPLPTSTSPELLEDFRLAQQHLQPLEWHLEPQPDGHQASDSGQSAEEGETSSPNFTLGSPNILSSGQRPGVGGNFRKILKIL